jgi:pimeloyl-ACP methyl ester carboxylesterase
VFSHGWPLSADDWDAQLLFFLDHGYRVVAHDRRGHGRSTQTADGHDMDHYADDLAALTAHLDLKNAIHVGHSTGGGEVAHYLGRHGESRVAKAALILIQAFVFEGFFGLLMFALVIGASFFAAAEADPVFRRAPLGFDALALFAVFVEIDDHRLCRSSLPAVHTPGRVR